MNYEFNPGNVDFGTPNAPITEPTGTQTIPQNQTPFLQQNTEQTVPQKQNQKTSIFHGKFLSIFNIKTGTVLATAIGLAIGFSFKDLVTSTISNIVLPIIIIILSYSPFLNEYLHITSYISQPNTTLNIPNFISTIVSFILTIIAVYYINIGISKRI